MTSSATKSAMDSTIGPVRAGAGQWAGLAVLLLPVALMTADLGVLWLATPYLTADLRPSGTELLWATDMYGFMTAGFPVVMGTLGDRVGRRRLLMAGSAGVIAASLLAAYARNPEVLIGARALLGIAGAAVLPSTLSLAGVAAGSGTVQECGAQGVKPSSSRSSWPLIHSSTASTCEAAALLAASGSRATSAS